jgi:hypothetical protein
MKNNKEVWEKILVQVLGKTIGEWKRAGHGIRLQILSIRLPGINNLIH